MKKSSWNYLVGALMFIDLASLAITGLLLAFLIPGGGGPAAGKAFLGLRRHDWRDLHFYLALAFLGLVSLHVSLNWTWVAQSSRRYFAERWKQFLWALCGGWAAVILIGWAIMRF